MSDEHTPGRWHIEEERWSGVFSGKRFVLYHIRDDTDLVAKVFSEEADAALIAAAPELLEALVMARELVRTFLVAGDPDEHTRQRLEIIENVCHGGLAKAEEQS